jgi:hypothetical protein
LPQSPAGQEDRCVIIPVRIDKPSFPEYFHWVIPYLPRGWTRWFQFESPSGAVTYSHSMPSAVSEHVKGG